MTNATSFAALIREKLQTPVELVKGGHGQFEVMVDGRIIAARKGGLLAKLLGRPWPEKDALLRDVKTALERPGSAED